MPLLVVMLGMIVHHLMHRKLFVFIGVVASWLCVEGCGLGTGTRDAERKESAIAGKS
jgi:hypothetical protein